MFNRKSVLEQHTKVLDGSLSSGLLEPSGLIIVVACQNLLSKTFLRACFIVQFSNCSVCLRGIMVETTSAVSVEFKISLLRLFLRLQPSILDRSC
jgi:hypothetical protein